MACVLRTARALKNFFVAKARLVDFKSHVYDKRQTSDSSWEFVRIENKQIKTVQNNSYG